MSLQEIRDVCIIAFTIAGTLLFIVSLFFTLVVGSLSWATVGRVRGVVTEGVQPTLENVRETTANVRGTVAFISDYAVKPVVRTYGIWAGARRFVVVVSRFRDRMGD